MSMSNNISWKDLLPYDIQRLTPLERQTEFEKLMKTLPKDSPQRKALKVFINSQYGTLGA
jgi:hypothetical protein